MAKKEPVVKYTFDPKLSKDEVESRLQEVFRSIFQEYENYIKQKRILNGKQKDRLAVH